MPDKLETIGRSQIQHGPENDRVYLMHLAPEDMPEILVKLNDLAGKNQYGKIFAKVPGEFSDTFVADGYTVEARVPDFFHGETEAVFLGKYFKPEREQEPKPELVDEVLAVAQSKSGGETVEELPYKFRLATPQDAESIAAVYRKVFATYPFPIHDPAYIADTMASNFLYFTLWEGEELVAVASCEMYPEEKNVEMTDFATLPKYRGKGTAVYLLERMEQVMAQHELKMAYTIARAYSFGMNITFAKLGYVFGGTLTRNTNIAGSLESMNVWYKPLPELVSGVDGEMTPNTNFEF
ncbi:MAG: putative beta-lysine N-acetyltransferase [Lentisphaeria bacterium]|nr:putative beta-lysine N-acetyltransferase [Candidatus Neomarinimicrobiota bacterium]MCF7842321.1 putative beta-lysine N-acetyltransferase [Lentisphaeria bacterium]